MSTSMGEQVRMHGRVRQCTTCTRRRWEWLTWHYDGCGRGGHQEISRSVEGRAGGSVISGDNGAPPKGLHHNRAAPNPATC